MTGLSLCADAFAALALLLSVLRAPRLELLVLSLQGASVAVAVWLLVPGTAGVVTGLLVLGTKVLLVPGLIARTGRRTGALSHREPRSWWSVAGIAATVVGVQALAPALGLPAGPMTAALLAMFLGLFGLCTRRILTNQMAALALMENGIYFSGLALGSGLPLIVDLGVVMDLLVALGILAWLTGHVHGRLGHLDADELNQLRG